ncbi:hypothetical protein [Cellulomonas soli]
MGDLVAVADLDAVETDAWPQVLRRLAGTAPLRAALLDPVRAERGGSAPSYTRWWVRTRSGLLDGGVFAVDGAQPALAASLPGPPAVLAGLDVAVQRALGGVARTGELDADGWTAVLRGLGRVGQAVEPGIAAHVWVSVARWALTDGARRAGSDDPDDGTDWAPATVPALVGPGRVAVVRTQDAAIAREPFWWQRTDVAAIVPAADALRADALASFLDVPLVDELADGHLDAARGVAAEVPVAVRDLLPGCPATWVEHEDLTVDGAPVDWWVVGDGPDAQVHATTTAGLAAGLAWAAGAWTARHAVELVLADPDRALEVRLDAVHAPDELDD